MQYEVRGFANGSAELVSRVVEAPSFTSAWDLATRQGLVVMELKPAEDAAEASESPAALTPST